MCGVHSELPVTESMVNRMGQFPVPNQIALELIVIETLHVLEFADFQTSVQLSFCVEKPNHLML